MPLWPATVNQKEMAQAMAPKISRKPNNLNRAARAANQCLNKRRMSHWFAANVNRVKNGLPNVSAMAVKMALVKKRDQNVRNAQKSLSALSVANVLNGVPTAAIGRNVHNNGRRTVTKRSPNLQRLRR